jgi:hypothetical protein
MEYTIENTHLPFGIEELNNQTYLKCLINENDVQHMILKNEIEEIETKEEITTSNLRKLKENNFILKVRVRNVKGRNCYEANYLSDEKYLKTINEISYKDKMNITFYLGKKYNKKYQDRNIVSIPLILKKITFL